MRTELNDIWACPYCRAKLGSDMLCGSCNEAFPINQGQPDLRTTKPVQIKLDYSYTPEFDNFPWEKATLEWPRNDNGMRMENGWEHTEKIMLASVERARHDKSFALDIGCGNNRQRFKDGLAELGHIPVGIDIGGTAPDAQADAHCLPFADATFDVILSSAVFEHLKNPFVAINELNRVAKPGARIYLSIAYNEPFHISFFHHSPMAVNELFTSVGLQAETFILSDKWNAFNAQLHMGFAGARLPDAVQNIMSGILRGYTLLPATIKGIIKNDKQAVRNARLSFARSHTGTVGIIAHKPL